MGCCWLSSLVLFRRPAHYRLTDRTRRAGRRRGGGGGSRYEGCTATTTTTTTSTAAAAAATDRHRRRLQRRCRRQQRRCCRRRRTALGMTQRSTIVVDQTRPVQHTRARRRTQAIDTPAASGPTRTRAHAQASAEPHTRTHTSGWSVVPTFRRLPPRRAVVVGNHSGEKNHKSSQNPRRTVSGDGQTEHHHCV